MNIEDTLLFIVEGRDGKRGLCKADGSELLPCVYGKIITAYGCCFYIDRKYVDKEGKVLFDPTGYKLIDKKSKRDCGDYWYFGDVKSISTAYWNCSTGKFVFVEISEGSSPRMIDFDNERIKAEEHCLLRWRFDFEKHRYVIDREKEEAIEEEAERRRDGEREEREWKMYIREANELFNDMMDENDAWGNID